MKKFHIVGAFDRHNYGDILFPIIHTKFIDREISLEPKSINYYAITRADLTACGGVKCLSIKDLYSNINSSEDRVILCGGDILAADWPLMIGHVSSPQLHFLFKVAKKILPFSIVNNAVKFIYGYKNNFPYVLSNKYMKGKFFYTCVGGSGFKPKNYLTHLQPICEELKQVEHISVRDKETQKVLEKYDVAAELIPDSALIMSDMFKKDELSQRSWANNIEISGDFSLEKYFVFQAGKTFVSHNISLISEQLKQIQEVTGLSILLLPIGRATGHEDDFVLQQIYNSLQRNGCAVGIQHSEHVLDIMASLAFAQCYIGTSLHGAISSYSFGNKVCGFSTDKVKKLRAFLETWMGQEDFCTVDDIYFSDKFLAMVKDKKYAIVHTDMLEVQKQLIYTTLKAYL